MAKVKPICVNSTSMTHMYQSPKPRSSQLHHHKRKKKLNNSFAFFTLNNSIQIEFDIIRNYLK